MLCQSNIVIRDAFNLIIGMSKATVQLTEPIARLFQVKNFAFVSTLMKDGSPQITPTWVDIEKSNEYSILVNTA
jgi:hypothetical protein